MYLLTSGPSGMEDGTSHLRGILFPSLTLILFSPIALRTDTRALAYAALVRFVLLKGRVRIIQC